MRRTFGLIFTSEKKKYFEKDFTICINFILRYAGKSTES